MKHLIITIPLAIMLAACSTQPEAGDEPRFNLEYLTQHWVHAFEEEQESDEAAIFRPADYADFPPARFRKQYIFYADSRCDWYYLAPDDGHHFRPGRWWLDPTNEDVLRIEEGDRIVSFRIVELSRELLRMVRLPD